MRKAVDINSQSPTTNFDEVDLGRDRSSVPLKSQPPHPATGLPTIAAGKASLAVQAESQPSEHFADDIPLDHPGAGQGFIDYDQAEDIRPFEIQAGSYEGLTAETVTDDDGEFIEDQFDGNFEDFDEDFVEQHTTEDAIFVAGDDELEDRRADFSAESVTLELRQIAGLTAGETTELQPSSSYDFSDSLSGYGFRIDVDTDGRSELIPGSIDAVLHDSPVRVPTPIGSGVLDVGNARFVVWPRRARRRATDWLDDHALFAQPEPRIFVAEDLVAPEVEPATKTRSRRRRPWSKKALVQPQTAPDLDDTAWDFIEEIRYVREASAQRQRYHYPDPAEIADRAEARAPILGERPQSHPLFGKVGSLVADMPWMPRFDRVEDIPKSLGPYLRPLMSLPSVPITSDLRSGPLGIVGGRSATISCARYLMLALFSASTAELRLHLATDEPEFWQWSAKITSAGDVYPRGGFPVLFGDGKQPLADAGIDPRDAVEGRLGLVACVEDITDLPSYCANVLQIRSDGTALLTNQDGHVISGTPVGMSEDLAASIAAELHHCMVQQGR